MNAVFGTWWRRVTLVGAMCLLPGLSHALGLADIQLDSHLNEKLDARIPLYDAEGLQSAEIIVSLASREDFDKVGVERFFFLTNMRFSVEQTDRGPEIRISSVQPISEPYLNFLVEVLWPQGRLLKEYTILLDPPTYKAEVAVPAQSPRAPAPVTPEPVREVPPQPAAPVADRGTRVNLTPQQPTPSARARSEAMTNQDDTMWSIASRNRPAGVSVNQYMLAIQRANPEAFIGNNINLLKAGYVLRMPSAADAGELTVAQAASEVERQTDVWRSGVVGSDVERVADTPAPREQTPQLREQQDATGRDVSPQPAPATASGQLEIVAGDGDSAQGAVGEAANQLAEENDRLSREVDELTYQLDREKELSSNQIAVKDRQIEVKDQQLAELREQLEQAQAQLSDVAGGAQNQTQTPREAELPLWQQPMFQLIAGAGVLILALAAALMFVRRRQQRADDEAYQRAIQEPIAGDADVDAFADLGEAEEEALSLDDEPAEDENEEINLLEGFDEDEAVEPIVAADEGPGAPSIQTSDVIGEADIYAAYGRYPHAIGLLTSALDEDADRHDVRLKLLEVCVAADDRQSFDLHANELMERCSDQDILLAARELEEGFGGEFVPAADTPAQTADEASASDSEFDLDLDTLDELDDLGDDANRETDHLGVALAAVEAQDDVDREVDDLLAEAEEDILSLDELDLETSAKAGDETAEDLVDELLADTADDDDAEGLLGSPVSETEELTLDESLDDDVETLLDELEDLDDLEEGVFGKAVEGPADSDEAAQSEDVSAATDTVEEFSLDIDDELDLDDDDVPVLEQEDAGDDLEAALNELVEDDYAPVPSQSAAEDSGLGGDLGLDFDPDAAPEETATDAGSQILALDEEPEDVEIDDLLAELDEDTELLADDAFADSSTQEEGSAEILEFSRPTDGETTPTSGAAAIEREEPIGLSADLDDDDDLDALTGELDAADTKLDLAQAYIDMGDEDGARDILSEVLQEGNSTQRDTAQNLLDGLAS